MIKNKLNEKLFSKLNCIDLRIKTLSNDKHLQHRKRAISIFLRYHNLFAITLPRFDSQRILNNVPLTTNTILVILF